MDMKNTEATTVKCNNCHREIEAADYGFTHKHNGDRFCSKYSNKCATPKR